MNAPSIPPFPFGPGKAISQEQMDRMAAEMEARVEQGRIEKRRTAASYDDLRVRPADIGSKAGPMHAASILAWTRIAEIAGVPHIPATLVAELDMETVERMANGDEDGFSEEGMAQIRLAVAHADAGGYWRTDICAGEEVKHLMGSGQGLPDVLPIRMDDLRIYEMHWGMPSVSIVGRPRLTPVRHAGYPVEFRVFHGCAADEDGAVSWYYPQAGAFEPTPELETTMDLAAEYGRRLHRTRAELGLTPWIPGQGEADDRIGSTIDFMLTEEAGLVMVDAGPGYGAGAHPCCFMDQPVAGRAWSLPEGVEPR